MKIVKNTNSAVLKDQRRYKKRTTSYDVQFICLRTKKIDFLSATILTLMKLAPKLMS